MSEHVIPVADGVALHVTDTDEGMPVIFQHGLGGDRNQVAESFPDRQGLRRITVECRGHGLSAVDPAGCYSIAGFGDDIMAVADRLGLRRFAVGGISMGAAIALRLAVLFPERVSALILVRPAWVTMPASENMKPFIEVAPYLRDRNEGARNAFLQSPTGLELARSAPDNLASLAGFFAREDRVQFAGLLEQIASDGPGVTDSQVAALRLPVLVVGHAMDHVHPLAHARQLAGMIAAAHFAEVTPKAVDKTRFFAELQAAIGAFLRTYVKEELAQ
jgi:pimeloyl-ACP methyl ester carboxylesterase